MEWILKTIQSIENILEDIIKERGMQKIFLNTIKTRWCNIDSNGDRDKIHLYTKSGKLVTRTAQYWEEFTSLVTGEKYRKCKITYKGKILFVSETTVLED
jgi:hypothetical protein